jgi:predicted SprT family Zn-dependent metalloprotease
LVGAALSVGVFYGCQKNQAIEKPSSSIESKSIEDKLLIDEAKTYFESRLVALKKQKEATTNKLKVRDNQTTDATFDGLDVTPKWDNAKVIRQNGSSFVETPFLLEGNKQFGLSISKNAQIAPDEKSASRLIVRKNSSGVQSANFMAVSADDEYLNGNNTSLKNFTYESVPNKFKGNEMHFNIDGSFKNGWHFVDGKADGTIKKVKVGSLGTRDACDVNICIWTWKMWTGTVSNPRQNLRETLYDCNSYSTRLLICNGWISPAEMNNNSNNNEWEGGDPAIGQIQYNGLTHDCYRGVIERLTHGGIDSDLNTFLQSFTDNTFNLTFYDDSDNFGSTLENAYNTFDKNSGQASIYLNHEALANASVEFIASTIIHEILHIYLSADLHIEQRFQYQHRKMGEEFGECLQDILHRYYPNLQYPEIQALTWKGLYMTQEYINQSEDWKTSIRTLANQHKNLNNEYGGNYGNQCH